MTPTEPLDRTHRESVVATHRIKDHAAGLHAQVARWEPRPCPPDFR